MEEELIPLSLDDTFVFSCSSGHPCFTECCRDLNQFLTPYDVLRLSRHLKMTTGEFLQAYTIRHTGPETGLPVVALRLCPEDRFACPFVTSSGCRVYSDRPSSCRCYPLVRMVSRSRETGRMTVWYALMKEDHCLGIDRDKTWTVREWIADQGLSAYNERNDRMMEIIALKNRHMPGKPTREWGDRVYTALYDLDAFCRQMTADGTWNRAPADDTALYDAALDWVRELVAAHES
jgi:Fe-S-cluster containining protein